MKRFLCVSVFVLSFWSHAGLCVCVGLYGKSEPTVVSGSIDKRLRATHVKFMYCAAFTKEPRSGFRGMIMPERRGGQSRGKLDGKKERQTGSERHSLGTR